MGKQVAAPSAVPDYSAFEESAEQRPEVMAQLRVLVDEQVRLELALEAAELALDQAKKDLAAVANGKLPELMEQCGMSEFKLPDGRKVKAGENVVCQISKENEPAAYAWLRANGHGGLIKRVVGAAFGVGKDEIAAALAAELREKGLDILDKSNVHYQTLQAFAREQLGKGVELPLDVFGVHRIKESKIVLPRQPKGLA